MNPETTAKMQQVALSLGHPWKFNHLFESCWAFQIIDGTGRGLHIGTESGNKLRISGLFPVSKTGHSYREGERNSIGVSALRPAKDIAADIQRRLIPHYLKSYDIAIERHRQEREAERLQRHIMTALAKIAPNGRIIDEGRYYQKVYFDNGKAALRNSTEIDLDLNRLPIEKAMQIIALLNDDTGGA